MLQQTRIATVRPYFQRFMARFPTVTALACAPCADVLKLWEGLGYYSRARHVQSSARQILALHNGQLPRTARALSTLPGIGPYTAAAIASICFGEKIPVVDGNVARVCSRYLGWRDDFQKPRARRKLAAWLQPALTAAAVPGDLNQALMELGECLCLPRTPACAACPLTTTCHACQSHTQEKFPYRPARRKVPTRHASAVIMRRRGQLLLVQRHATGLLGGFWELPGGESSTPPDARAASAAVRRQTGITPAGLTCIGEWEHVFSHFRLRLHVYTCQQLSGRLAPQSKQAQWTPPAEIARLPVATLHRRVLSQHPLPTRRPPT
jgi:A/G-specific adenine glycosylase